MPQLKPAPCHYPPCDNTGIQSVGIQIEPEPIDVWLCGSCLAVVDSNEPPDEDSADFWRWFDAASGMLG